MNADVRSILVSHHLIFYENQSSRSSENAQNFEFDILIVCKSFFDGFFFCSLDDDLAHKNSGKIW